MEGKQWTEGQREEAQPEPILVRLLATLLCVRVLSSHKVFAEEEMMRRKHNRSQTTSGFEQLSGLLRVCEFT
jgi:hypothetical protein